MHAVARVIPGYRLVETLHESAPRVVYRALRDGDGEDVVLKTLLSEYPDKRDVAELRREHRIASRLRVEGVIEVRELVTFGAGIVAIEMPLFGRSLADLLIERGGAPLSVERFLDLAIRLAQILGRLHELDVVHKDVVPRNVLCDAHDELRLIDFGIASELSREHQSITLAKRLEGSLPYISPEQTGRMNRDLDYRSDYYSLGCTFFELLTGRLPFEASSALEWVHRHISHPAPRAHEVSPDVPEALSRIVEKLMAKSAEDRYQSTYGLCADLARCRDALRAGRATAFALGRDDVSRRFQIPQRLYGREAELAQLRAIFDDVAHGATGLCLVSGAAGVGKSALVHELERAIVKERGYLAGGKFDQFAQSEAYAAVSAALESLAGQLLTEPEERLAAWRAAIRAAAGANARLLVELAPSFAPILGPTAPVPELPPTEAQNRLSLVFAGFVKVFAELGHPLVLFLDDLQWSDVPTLDLIQRLVTARDLGHLLVIGAYREHRVDVSHPLRVTLDAIREARDVVELALAPLALDAVEALVADTLAADRERARGLAALVHEKSQGNPFFLGELLGRLRESGAIAFDPAAGRWGWDEAAVRRADVGEDVVDFLVASLRRLPEATQRALTLAACIGSTFDLRTLAIIGERNPDTIGEDLHEALRRLVLVPLSESYTLVGLGGGDGGVNPTYRFQHDRVQQAAYALIAEADRQAVHLSIGRLMLRGRSEEELDERLIEVVGHLNAGRARIESPVERRELAALNLRAGIRAQRSSAYAAARELLAIGQALLGPRAWEEELALMSALSREYQQCAYLTGDLDEADAWIETLLAHATTPLEKAEILSTRTRQYSTTGRMRESIRTAIEGLNLLGVAITEQPGPEVIEDELANVARSLGGRRIEDLIDAPPLTDPTARVAIRLLMEIFPAAFLSGSGALFPYLVLKSVDVSLRHGTSPETAFAYAAYGMLLCGVLGDPALGHRYGRLAVRMNDQLADIALKSRVIYVYAMFVHHWSEHWSSMTPWFLRGIEAGYQSGDLLYLAYSAQDCIIWDPKLDLEVAEREQEKYLRIVADCEYQDSLDSGTLFLQMQRCFLGRTNGPTSLSDAAFDEAACLAGMRGRGFMTGVANYHIYKAEVCWLHDDLDGALEHAAAMDELVASAMSLPQLVRFRIVSFLARAARSPALGPSARTELRARLEADLAQMTSWAAHCPSNFAHLRDLMRAELARIDGRMDAALAEYERAIAAARAHEFRRDEAMACERAGEYLTGLGLDRAAEGYLRAAAYLYDRWGAHRKVELLRARHPGLATAATAPAATRTSGSTTGSMDSAALDLASVMKAAQAISGELALDRLLRTTMQLVLESAGAQTACFVVREGDELVVRARVAVGREPSAPASLERVTREDPTVPASMINAVLRTGQPLVLHDATQAGRFSSDPYLARHAPRSVLCVPMQRQGRFDGAIYLENHLAAGAFTEDRVELIRLLSSQASISMENAKLYEDQARLIEAQQRFVPSQFLESLGHHDIAGVGLGESVAREMSVMFADLRDFTPLAERLGPRAMIELLNRYFSRVGAPIGEAGGFIDSYNGDEIMALFGVAPDRAVGAGVRMCHALDAFNEELTAGGGPTLRLGIGLNTGPLVLGTVGGHDRLKCGVVGDTVNLASRIEQLTKRYGARFLIGEHTRAGLRDAERYSLRRVDRVAVKGKARAVVLHEVLDAELPSRRAAKEATRAAWEAATERYLARDFEGAARAFAALAGEDPEDAVFPIFAERAARYREEPPGEAWDGVETLTTK